MALVLREGSSTKTGLLPPEKEGKSPLWRQEVERRRSVWPCRPRTEKASSCFPASSPRGQCANVRTCGGHLLF